MSRDDWKTMAINLQQEVHRLRGLLGQDRLAINHKKLLRKYIRYVDECEGIDYIRNGPFESYVKFTKAEWAELRRLARMRAPRTRQVTEIRHLDGNPFNNYMHNLAIERRLEDNDEA